MKKLLVCLLLVCGCGAQETKVIYKNDEAVALQITGHADQISLNIIKIEGCEYIFLFRSGSIALTHKGDCKYCQNKSSIHRLDGMERQLRPETLEERQLRELRKKQ
jgi:hypothetical protein